MKKKFSKILGVGLTIGLLTSLLLTVVPVSAVTQPVVTLDDNQISRDLDYFMTFILGADWAEGEVITIDFPAGTALTNVSACGVTLSATSGIARYALAG